MRDSDRYPKSDFVEINGVNLHYLDWGGEGPCLLLLAGFSNSAHIFKSFAVQFTNKFRVFGLTRRCHGKLEITQEGYDIDSRVNDILKFLDFICTDNVILLGHSMAGDELSHFANLYPDRSNKLVYLDAAVDRSILVHTEDPLRNMNADDEPEEVWSSVEEFFDYCKRNFPIMSKRWDVWQDELLAGVDIDAGGRFINRFTPEIAQKMMAEAQKYKPNYSRVRCPAISFYSIPASHPGLPKNASEEVIKAANAYYWDVIVAWKRACADRFLDEVEYSEVVEVSGAHHYLFIDMEDDIANQTRSFLLKD